MVTREVEDTVLRNLQLETLRNALAKLDANERRLIYLYYEREMTVREVGDVFGVSGAAISKRLKKLCAKLRDSVV